MKEVQLVSCIGDKLVSVVFPVYNNGERLISSVQAILEQSYRNIEVILVDDGSKDNSLAICNQISNRDDRVKVVHTENQGSGPARNVGIANASGQYIYFPDSDDYVDPNAIEILVSSMTEGCDLVVFGFKTLSVDGKKVIRTKTYKELIADAELLRNDYSKCFGSERELSIQGAPWNKFFSLDLIKKNSIEFPPLRRHQDEAFISRYMCYATKVHFIPDVLYDYYSNDISNEWKKYPVNYIDAVTGLYAIRKQTILTWNQNDTATHDSVYCEYICKLIKAFELSFSPKMNFTNSERKKWVSEHVISSGILEVKQPDILGKYQRIILKLMRKGNVGFILILFRFKIFVETIGLKSTIRK